MKQILLSEVKKVQTTVNQMNFQNISIYSNWLAQTYYFVRHSTRLLALSAALCPFELQGFHQRALDHAAEEKNHEKMLIHDLKHLGTNISDFPESPVTASFYQTQYYAIENIHPLAFLGYVSLLEMLPITVGLDLLPKIEATFGKNATSFLRVHSQEDVDHMKSLEGVLASLDISAQKVIEQNLKQATFLYCTMLSEIQQSNQVKKAA